MRFEEVFNTYELHSDETQSVNRTPTRTACTDAHSVSAHHTAQPDHFSSREHAWLKPWCAENILSSTRHLSFLAAPDTDHQHKFSLTHLSNLTLVFTHTLELVDARSIYTLRRVTAEWRIFGNPVSHTWCIRDQVLCTSGKWMIKYCCSKGYCWTTQWTSSHTYCMFRE